MRSLNHTTSYLWPRGWTDRQTDRHRHTHTHTHTHTRTHTHTHTHTHILWQHESDFKKPGACQPGWHVPGLKNKYVINTTSEHHRFSESKETKYNLLTLANPIDFVKTSLSCT